MSFGDDRQEPRSRRALFRRPPVVAGLVVVLLAGLGLAGWRFYEDSRRPLSPPDGPRLQSGSFSVYLCDRSGTEIWSNCHHRTATAEDRRAIEVALRALPQIRDFHFESKEQAFEIFRQGLSDDPSGLKVLSVTGADDMPESYTGDLGPGDWGALRRRLEALPGVSNVYIFGDTLWKGIADVGIKFCPEESDLYESCRGHRKASEREKAAVLDRIGKLDGVQTVYFEDVAHALEDNRRILWNGGSGVGPRALPEAFYVKFDRPPARADMEKVFGRMPGVAEVVLVS
ncbi:permease-like cell division protein FtsX [Microbispora sp. NPDC049633]|uniref:permease-like cell division protein FtsX n=1 Tax=Microbispora sp. NPDC049633 TaxID=3154355 RepID=UPI003438A3AB